MQAYFKKLMYTCSYMYSNKLIDSHTTQPHNLLHVIMRIIYLLMSTLYCLSTSMVVGVTGSIVHLERNRACKLLNKTWQTYL